jgi:cyclic di-GMP phosphodiesterase Gmr
LVKAITAVAKEFGMKIVAEGVETLYQAEFLKSLNIDYAQGYYFAKPMDSEFLHVWLGKRQKAA